MPSTVFQALCEQLGLSPDAVLSVRVNPHQVVAVVRNAERQLQVVNFAHEGSSLRLLSKGRPFGREPQTEPSVAAL